MILLQHSLRNNIFGSRVGRGTEASEVAAAEDGRADLGKQSRPGHRGRDSAENHGSVPERVISKLNGSC